MVVTYPEPTPFFQLGGLIARLNKLWGTRISKTSSLHIHHVPYAEARLLYFSRMEWRRQRTRRKCLNGRINYVMFVHQGQAKQRAQCLLFAFIVFNAGFHKGNKGLLKVGNKGRRSDHLILESSRPAHLVFPLPLISYSPARC